MNIYRFLVAGLLFVLIGFTFSCVKQDTFSNVPAIEFLGQTKTMLHQGALMEDSLYIKFSFQDGDGDIGDTDSINVFVTDTRQNFASSYRLPNLTNNSSGTSLEGEITMLLFTTCCLYDNNSQAPCTPSTTQPTDEVIYTIQIKDRAGHLSNVISLNPITVMCD